MTRNIHDPGDTDTRQRRRETARKKHKSANESPFNRLLAKLSESGLTRQDAKALGFQPYSEEESKRLGLSRSGAGFKIPYYSADGKRLKMYRYRFFDTVAETGFLKGVEQRKYDQPPNTHVEIYLPFIGGAKWPSIKGDSSQPIFFTEGEIKAACATKHGFPTMGLGGVFNFGCKKKHQHLIPSLEAFEWEGRNVYITFDSDIHTNPMVLLAAVRLARALTDRGAHVFLIRIPPEATGKVGLDDYIVKHGVDAFKAIVSAAEEWSQSATLHELNTEFAYLKDISMVAQFPACASPEVRLYKPTTWMYELIANRAVTETVPLPSKAKGDRKNESAEEVRTKIVDRPAGPIWMGWPGRNEVESLTYAPGQPLITRENKLNLWRESDCKPQQGNTGPFDKLMTHLLPNSVEREYVECWFAAPLQTPGLKMYVAVVVWSSIQGNGKTLLGTTIGRIHGLLNYAEITQTELCSNYNDWLANKTFIQGSEVCGEKDSRAVADKLKTIISGDVIPVSKKYQPFYVVPNRANLYLASNHENAIYMGELARRFAVFHVKAEPLPAKFYADYCKWLDNGGLSAIFHRLLTKDISKFNPKAHALRTEAREAMIEASRTQIQSWCHELRVNTDTALSITGSRVTAPGAVFTTRELLRIFEGGGQTRLTEKGVAAALREEGFTMANNGGLIRIPGTVLRLRLWVVRDALRVANMTPGEVGEMYAKNLRVPKPFRVGR